MLLMLPLVNDGIVFLIGQFRRHIEVDHVGQLIQKLTFQDHPAVLLEFTALFFGDHFAQFFKVLGTGFFRQIIIDR